MFRRRRGLIAVAVLLAMVLAALISVNQLNEKNVETGEIVRVDTDVAKSGNAFVPVLRLTIETSRGELTMDRDVEQIESFEVGSQLRICVRHNPIFRTADLVPVDDCG